MYVCSKLKLSQNLRKEYGVRILIRGLDSASDYPKDLKCKNGKLLQPDKQESLKTIKTCYRGQGSLNP